jgi:hypothetical protein
MNLENVVNGWCCSTTTGLHKRNNPVKYVGIDLHKQTISGCVVVKERGQKKIAARTRLECRS